MLSGRTKLKAAGKAARGAGKASGGTGKTLLSGGRRGMVARKAAGKAVRGASKATLKGGRQALKGGALAAEAKRSGGGNQYLKYGLFAILGFAAGALIARSGKETEVSPSFTGETWGGGAGLREPGPPGATPSYQRPGDAPHTGFDRDYSDPSSGPLIGRQHGAGPPEIPEQQDEVEQRIRTRVGEDPRTAGMERINVEVNDGVADIRGIAPSEEAKSAVTEIAEAVEGVNEVRNLITVGTPGSQGSTGGGTTGGSNFVPGGEEPDPSSR